MQKVMVYAKFKNTIRRKPMQEKNEEQGIYVLTFPAWRDIRTSQKYISIIHAKGIP
jgi:hypothetical protein